MAIFAVRLYDDYQVFLDNYQEIKRSKKLINLINNQTQEHEVPSKLDFTIEEDSLSPQSQEPEFTLVNRDRNYLKQAALEYAKEYDLKEEIDQMYDETFIQSHQTYITAKKNEGNKRVVQRRSATRPHKSTFFWPLEPSSFWLSSRFGPRKKEDGSNGFHYGIDMAASRGTPIKAAGLGLVIEAGYNNGYGKTIVIAHADGIHQTRYAHLDKIMIKRGQRVLAGQKIGTVGDTGAVRGQGDGKNAHHLHFEVKRHKKHIDPLKVLSN